MNRIQDIRLRLGEGEEEEKEEEKETRGIDPLVQKMLKTRTILVYLSGKKRA